MFNISIFSCSIYWFICYLLYQCGVIVYCTNCSDKGFIVSSRCASVPWDISREFYHLSEIDRRFPNCWVLIQYKSAVPNSKIKRSDDHLISTMAFPILIRWHLYNDSWPRTIQKLKHPGPVPISDKPYYCKISQSLEAAKYLLRIIRSLWNLTGTSAATLPMCLSNFKAMR